MRSFVLTLLAASLAIAALPAAAAEDPQVCAATPVGYVDPLSACDPDFSVYVVCVYGQAGFTRFVCVDHSFDGSAHCRGVYAMDLYTIQCNSPSSGCPYYEDTRLIVVHGSSCRSQTGPVWAQLP